MSDLSWLVIDLDRLLPMVLSGAGIYAALIALTRFGGLRSLSKLSSYDLATTVALGSIVAATLLDDRPPLAAGLTALVILFGLQFGVSAARRASRRVERLVDNRPRLVLADGVPLDGAMAAVRLTPDDLRAALRQAGVTDRRQVRAVVFETTGDLSVLTSDGAVDPWLLADVEGAEPVS